MAFGRARLVGGVGACAALLAVAFVLAAAFGERTLSPSAVLTAGTTDATIFFLVRLPRVILAGIVGASLAASGCTLQSLTRNPLADPFVLGVSGGAALGATIALALGLPSIAALGLSAASVFALGGALGATVLVMALGRAADGSPHATLLAGVIWNAFSLAAVLFVKALVAPDRLGEVLFWLAGSLKNEETPALVAAGVLVGAGVLLQWGLAGRLNLLMLGDDDAATLGIDVKKTRALLLVATSLTVAVAVSLSGLVGFVGLLVPHVARLIFGPDNRVVVPASALLGAAFLMLADLVGRLSFLAFNSELPVGVVTALLGCPVFLILMSRRPVRG